MLIAGMIIGNWLDFRRYLMKAKNIIVVLIGFASYFMFRGIIFPYDNIKAHPSFNETIIKFVEENSQNYFNSNYLIKISKDLVKYKGKAVTNPGFFDLSTGESEVDYSIYEWIRHGGFSADEPELAASVRHFFDPIALSGGKKHLTNRGTYWEGIYPNPETDAIEWALGDTPKGADNKWTLQKGKQYLQSAFELALDDNMKSANLAKAFRCLGEVLHNTADLGCPPHTRNDSHAAPIGYEGGALLGSPDAYEELFDINWLSVYMNAPPDPNLKSFCDNATNIRSIHEKLAEFTNYNFFTGQTINGVGNKLIYPINKDGNYPSPLLQDLEYETSNYTYYKTFSSGHKVKMAKDKSFFIKRGYPYIDRACVMSQANELIPNVICAASNVIRLFIPKFRVMIASIETNGEVIGKVEHIPTAEYSTVFDYSGKIDIYDSKSSEKIGTVDCNYGDFSGTISGLKLDDELYANLELAGINIKSEVYKVGLSFKHCDIRLSVVWIADTLKGEWSPGWYTDGSFKDNVYTGTINKDQHGGGNVTGSIRVEVDDDFNIKTLNVTAYSTDEYGSSQWGFTAANISPTENEPYLVVYNFSGNVVCSYVTSIYAKYTNLDQSYTEISRFECEEESLLHIKFHNYD